MRLFVKKKDASPSEFIDKIVEVERNLTMRIDFLESKTIEEAHKFISEYPYVKNDILKMIKEYDYITATGRTIDLAKPFSYEDEHGFRYNSMDEIVCYPKDIYSEKRNDFLVLLSRISSLIDIEEP